MYQSKPTQPMFLALVAEEEPVVEVDASDFVDDDGPTVPLALPPPERDTARPSAEGLEALLDASRDEPTWLGEPRFSFDPETGRLVLAEHYVARQRDAFGNVFSVDCRPGLEVPHRVDDSSGRAVRTALVAASLRARRVATVIPFNGGGKLHIPMDQQWQREILKAFSEGDAGAVPRGG